jgi:hypothetical protein
MIPNNMTTIPVRIYCTAKLKAWLRRPKRKEKNMILSEKACYQLI